MAILFRLLIGCVILFIFSSIGCAPPLTPTIAPTKTSAPTAEALAKTTQAKTPLPSATWTPTNTLTAIKTDTPTKTLTPSVMPTEFGRIQMINAIEPYKLASGEIAYRSPYLRGYYEEYFGCEPDNVHQTKFDIRQVDLNGQTYFYCFSRILNYDISALSLLTLPDPLDLVDENGQEISLERPDPESEFGFLQWRKTDKRRIVLPLVFPRVYGGRNVIPLLKWMGTGDYRRITGWQIWLIDRQTTEPVRIIEHPFVALQPEQKVAFDPLSGYLQIVEGGGDFEVSTGRTLGERLSEPPRADGQVDGMAFYGGFKQTDIAFYRQEMDWLQAKVPKWHDYVIGAQPFFVVYDPQRNYATGSCCDLLGRGRVTFPGLIGNAKLNESQIIETVSVLIHEIAHVRDGRNGNLKIRRLKADCQLNETSAVKQQNAFLNDLVLVMPDYSSEINALMAANNQYAREVPYCR